MNTMLLRGKINHLRDETRISATMYEEILQAANLIDQQQAEIVRKTELLEKERSIGYTLIKKAQEQQAEIERLRFELTATLPYVQAFHNAEAVIEQIAKAEPQVSSDKFVSTCLQSDEFLNVRQIARNYLKGADDK